MEHLMGPTTALFLWEIGLVGTALAFLILYLIFRDALVAREADGITGALALGWIAVIGIMFLAWFYKKTVGSDALSYLFWFYSGVIAAASLRIRREDMLEVSCDASRFDFPPSTHSRARVHPPLRAFDAHADRSSCESTVGSEPPEYAVITGNGRSGTNWLETILDASPLTHCRSEPYGIPTSPFNQVPHVWKAGKTAPDMERLWDEIVMWSRSRIGQRDHAFTNPKRYVHPLAQMSGITRLIAHSKSRRMIAFMQPSLRQGEWQMPWWIGSQRRLEQAYPVFKIDLDRADGVLDIQASAASSNSSHHQTPLRPTELLAEPLRCWPQHR